MSRSAPPQVSSALRGSWASLGAAEGCCVRGRVPRDGWQPRPGRAGRISRLRGRAPAHLTVQPWGSSSAQRPHRVTVRSSWDPEGPSAQAALGTRKPPASFGPDTSARAAPWRAQKRKVTSEGLQEPSGALWGCECQAPGTPRLDPVDLYFPTGDHSVPTSPTGPRWPGASPEETTNPRGGNQGTLVLRGVCNGGPRRESRGFKEGDDFREGAG